MNGVGNVEAPGAIILAAGKGTRMNSDLPKVCHPVGGRAMVCAVVDACIESGCDRIGVVVGYRQEKVREALSEYAGRIEFVEQREQLGTGDAVKAASGLFAEESGRDVFVLCGDGPLIHVSTLSTVLETHRRTGASATLATSVIDDPTGYGRIVRGAGGRFERIVEQKNATPEQLRIREVNPSYYCFRSGSLWRALAQLQVNPSSHEYYVTDVPAIMLSMGERVEVIEAVPPEDVLSINTPAELALVDRIYRARIGGEQR
ncbi:MAG: hypothetical protein EDM82_10685 [Cyanobacteria bacterium CYA]|nr:MAG: hypothetical protein EDM82_10685 [Cyanobacteria bacterium CYA]